MKNVIILSLILFVGNLSAQVVDIEKKLKTKSDTSYTGWKKGGAFNFNISQVSLTNWSSGGQNTISGGSLLSVYANYVKDKRTWDNSLELGYGLIRQGKDDLRKSDDKIDFTSKYGAQLKDKLYFAGLIGFRSQFTGGYNYPDVNNKISDFFAPAYLLGALGVDYKPSKSFSLFFAPFTSKTTFVLNDSLSKIGAFGVDENENFRSEFGGYLKSVINKDIAQNISVVNKFDLFSNYINKPQNIDINWEILITMKISKYFNANIGTHLIYDDDVKIAIDNNDDGLIDKESPILQFKEVVNFGFSLKF